MDNFTTDKYHCQKGAQYPIVLNGCKFTLTGLEYNQRVMKKCIIIVNKMSGNGKRVDSSKLRAVFGDGFDVELVHLLKRTKLSDLSQYDRIVICGGDGSLNGIINCKRKPMAELIYCPFGTLNELANGSSDSDDFMMRDVGAANSRRFAYVCACGIFTPLGYIVKNKNKRRFKSLAYLARVIDQYKIYRMKADMLIDDTQEQGEWSLIMAIDSPRCFGFRFNKMFRLDDGVLHLLAIRSPKHNGLLGKIELFFPLFRAFFIGFKKEYNSKRMFFRQFKHLNLDLEQNTDFCMDGECVPLSGEITLEAMQIDTPIHIMTPHAINSRYKTNTPI